MYLKLQVNATPGSAFVWVYSFQLFRSFMVIDIANRVCSCVRYSMNRWNSFRWRNENDALFSNALRILKSHKLKSTLERNVNDKILILLMFWGIQYFVIAEYMLMFCWSRCRGKKCEKKLRAAGTCCFVFESMVCTNCALYWIKHVVSFGNIKHERLFVVTKKEVGIKDDF